MTVTQVASASLRPRTRSLAGLAFLVIMAGGFVMAALGAGGFRPEAEVPLQYLLSGGRAAEFARTRDDRLPFKPLAIRAWGTLEFLAFREGRRGVLVGDDGWLFSDEEFTYFPHERDEVAAKLRFVGEVRDTLEQSGSALVVALIPAKARVEREHLGRYLLPPYVDDRYDSFRAALAEVGVAAPDLHAPLVAAKGAAEVFCQSDTHWTPHGAAVAARVVADEIGRLAPDLPRSTFVTTLESVVNHSGDLTSFVPVADWAAHRLVVDRIEVMTTEKVAGEGEAVGLFDVVALPVAVVGTSYSASPLWNFAGALEEASGLEVLNVADEGRGPILPMADFLASEAYLETPPAVVVWEIPERYLPVHYEASLPARSQAASGEPAP